ncbi:hypothetical protein DAI22_04g181400 [Oryza sativa Japonica Group]|nr:hypothetical protein DAI22_04g181400 [Oryza sativa Japonica Group]
MIIEGPAADEEKTHKSIPRFHLRNPRYRRGRSRRAPPSRLPPPSSHAAARRLRRSSSPFVPSILLRLSSTEAPPHHEGNFTVRTLGSMSYFQATTYKPHNGIIVDKVAIGLGSTCKLLHERAKCSYSNRFIKLQEQVYPRLLLVAACHNRIGPVYASSGKGNSERVNDYIHIIRGEELYRLARDYTRYLVTGKRTSRLKRAMLNWHNFCEGITNKDSVQESTFERSTSEPMWWQQPLKFVHRIEELYRGYFRPHAQES